MRVFAFDPVQFAPAFAARGYVHIREGLTEEYYRSLVEQVAMHLRRDAMPAYARGDKQQARYEFPDADGYRQLREAAAGICGLDPRRVVVSERHVKAYEADADPLPPAHKDRWATQVALGFAVHVPAGSTLEIYPRHDFGPNPFNSWAEMRASLPAEKLPEAALAGVEPVAIHDSPRDVVLFQGSRMWHRRVRAAGTVMLYFKLNAWNADPIGEDPDSPEVRSRSRALLALPDGDFDRLVPLVGRKVDTFQRRYTRDGREVLGVALYEDRFVAVDEEEWQLLQAVDGRRTVAAILEAGNLSGGRARVRRLAACGVLDLTLPEPSSPASSFAPGSVLACGGPALEPLDLPIR
jgi:hypothetical protein